jgi:uncharacterized protein (TIGR03067 family)
MSDESVIQGAWRVVSIKSDGHAVGSSASHYIYDRGTQKEIVPDLVDDGKLRSTYELDTRKNPKRMVMKLDYNGPNGPPDPHPIILHYVYSLKGSKLILCCGRGDVFPSKLSDKGCMLTTLVREKGPVPEMKKPSGKPPIQDKVLGTLKWEDNFEWWSTKVKIGSGFADLSINARPNGKNLKAMLKLGQQFVQWLRKHEVKAREFAAEWLLDLHNDSWNEGRSTSRSAFIKRMKLGSVVLSTNGATLYYRDGGLFWGHSILVNVTKRLAFKDANIAG